MPTRIPEGFSGVLTPEDVAAMFKLSTGTVHRMVKKGQLPFFRMGKLIRFNRTQIEQFLKTKKKRRGGHVKGRNTLALASVALLLAGLLSHSKGIWILYHAMRIAEISHVLRW